MQLVCRHHQRANANGKEKVWTWPQGQCTPRSCHSLVSIAITVLLLECKQTDRAKSSTLCWWLYSSRCGTNIIFTKFFTNVLLTSKLRLQQLCRSDTIVIHWQPCRVTFSLVGSHRRLHSLMHVEQQQMLDCMLDQCAAVAWADYQLTTNMKEDHLYAQMSSIITRISLKKIRVTKNQSHTHRHTNTHA